MTTVQVEPVAQTLTSVGPLDSSQSRLKSCNRKCHLPLTPLGLSCSGRVVGGRSRWLGGAASRWDAGAASGVVSRADGAELNVGEGNMGIGNIALEISRNTGGDGARATSNTRLRSVAIERVVGVEPEHAGVVLEARVSNCREQRKKKHTSCQRDIERTIPRLKAAPMPRIPPLAVKGSESWKKLFWSTQNSEVSESYSESSGNPALSFWMTTPFWT